MISGNYFDLIIIYLGAVILLQVFLTNTNNVQAIIWF